MTRGRSETFEAEDLLTLADAAALVGKTPSNISYLVQYSRIRRYDARGRVVSRAPNGGLRVSRRELLDYMERWNRRVRSRMEELEISDTSIAFLEVPERERTKHVHRLHPYLGKFIPQLVGHFLSRYVEPGQVVLDPFSGSGTTLVEASERGVHGIGIEVSRFNVMISRVKLATYDLESVESEVAEILERTAEFSAREFPDGGDASAPRGRRGYLETWFATRSLAEMRCYRDAIPDYNNQDLLKVLLSRTARSCRLVHHYDLATPKEPVRAPYSCYKHQGKTCEPVTSILPRLRFYSRDTVRRISEFQGRRGEVASMVVEGDSREVDVAREMRSNRGFPRSSPDAIFTSPPYVGQIDYHEQHRYAYELFGIDRKDDLEIGPKTAGKSGRARDEYSRGIARSLANVSRGMKAGAPVIVVANDRLGLYPSVFEQAGMRVEKRFERPVEDRTERDKSPYSETVFLARVEG